MDLFFLQAEDGIRDAQESRGLGDVYKRQIEDTLIFVVIGANGFILIGFRFALAITLTYLLYRSRLFNAQFNGFPRKDGRIEQ